MPGYGFSGKPTETGGARPHRSCLRRADEAPRLRTVRGGGRRLRRARRRLHGRRARRPRRLSRRRRSCSGSTPTSPACSRRRRHGDPDRRRAAARSLSRRATRGSRSWDRVPTRRMPWRWGRTRRRCTDSRTHPSAWPPGMLDHDPTSYDADRPRLRRTGSREA